MSTLSIPSCPVAAGSTPVASGSGDIAARWLAGGLLLGAAFLKWHQAVAYGDFGGFSMWHKPAAMALVAGQVLLGVALLSGVLPSVMKWVAVAVFTGFAGYSTWRWLGGYASCGCFGAVKVDPRITLGIDLGVVALFLLSGTAPLRSTDWRVERRVLATVAVAAGLLVIPAGVLMAGAKPVTLGAHGIEGGEGQVIRLESREWVGQRLPILPHLHGESPRLDRGRWLVVLWNSGCGHCWNRLPEFMQAVKQNVGLSGLVIVNVAPEREESRNRLDGAIADRSWVHVLTLDPARRWSSATPRALEVADGTVVAHR